ncbi:hypothetical protein [uncultured Flavobacterium sp.]|uniref:hypothetical protein n=1 Tax=uncultured Flavobacterium sp. TaxID=165435 RepID=UPI002931138D|nr:hypothetical protein [uncultured Flavobacterium sp.]
MKLVELISYFRNSGSYENFCCSESLDLKSEVVEIYMEAPLSLNNELMFFEIEKTDGKFKYVFGNTEYFNFVDFFFFLDFIKESNNDNNKLFSDAEIADRLLSYVINDA